MAYETMVAELYERGKALNAGSLFEVDEVIDPAETRRWLIAGPAWMGGQAGLPAVGADDGQSPALVG